MINNKNSAFTLVELSIVLVIIGLVIGGVLVGKDMIEAAKSRKIITEINDIDVAFNSFYLKYNCLPGDCENQTDFFSEAALDGDGDELIDWYWEVILAWEMLSVSGMIWGSYTGTGCSGINLKAGENLPESSFCEGCAYQVRYNGEPRILYGYTENLMSIALHDCNDGWPLNSPAMTPFDAYQIDKKVDDGTATDGSFIGIADAEWWDGVFQSDKCSTGVVTAGGTPYKITEEDKICVLYKRVRW